MIFITGINVSKVKKLLLKLILKLTILQGHRMSLKQGNMIFNTIVQKLNLTIVKNHLKRPSPLLFTPIMSQNRYFAT
jgi:hypothetical protein